MTATLTEIPARTLDVMRRAWLPLLSTDQIELLRAACEAGTEELIQCATTVPPPLTHTRDWPCEGACLVGFSEWKTEGLHSVEQVDGRFARVCFEIDQRMGEPAACRWLLNFWDDTPRHVVLPLMAAELGRELESRCNRG